MMTKPTTHDDSGFSLIETIIAMGILATGLLGLAGVFTLGMAHMATSSANLVAREKAREAVESVHTARDTRTISWCQIYNVSSTPRSAECATAAPGVFLDGPQDLKDPGVDGLVNTADDSAEAIERQPGPDGVFGTVAVPGDDIPMTNFKRTILISNLTQDDGTGINQDLRQITVTITYNVGPVRRTYVLNTYVSRIS
jgi:prepilin-type N-terminal cleavage/methylation domain-containing protein